MTADSRRVYFTAAHATQPQMLIYDMDGSRQEAAEFNIHALGAGRSFNAIAHDAENLYLVSNSPGLGSIADVYPYSKLGTAGRRFALEGIADNLNSTFEAVKGAVFLNEEIVVLLQRAGGAAVDGTVQTGRIVCVELVQCVGNTRRCRPTGHDTGGESGVCA